MDEALRRAYLAAMDIPVWIPRGEEDVFARSPGAPAEAPSRSSADRSESPAADTRTPPPRVPASSSPRAAPPRPTAVSGAPARAAPASAIGFGFVRCGATLIVDESRLSARGGDLARAICLAVERQKLPADTQDFIWPPQGAPLVAAEALEATEGGETAHTHTHTHTHTMQVCEYIYIYTHTRYIYIYKCFHVHLRIHVYM